MSKIIFTFFFSSLQLRDKYRQLVRSMDVKIVVLPTFSSTLTLGKFIPEIVGLELPTSQTDWEGAVGREWWQSLLFLSLPSAKLLCITAFRIYKQGLYVNSS